MELAASPQGHDGVAVLRTKSIDVRVGRSVDFPLTVELLNRAFPHGYRRGADYLEWLYTSTVKRPAIAVEALSSGAKVGQIIFLPHLVARGGADLLLGQTIDFFMLAEYRTGPSIIRLLRAATEAGEAQGLDGLYGAPNGVSRTVSGRFLKPNIHMKLDVRLGMTWRRTPATVRISAPASALGRERLKDVIAPYLTRPHVGRIWTAEDLAHRLLSPVSAFAVHGTDTALAISCTHKVKGANFTMLCAFMSKEGQPMSHETTADLVQAACDLQGHAKYCYVGINDALERAPGTVVPDWIRPSPLEFMGRLFKEQSPDFKLSRFELVDFDIV